jgi:hypothetical protein
MSRSRSSNSNYSRTGNERNETLDVCDVPDRLAEMQNLAEQIRQKSPNPEIQQLALRIEEGLDPAISAMARAVDQLLSLEGVA